MDTRNKPPPATPPANEPDGDPQLERFKNRWAGWQSIATILALGLGGWWTVRVFSGTKQRDAAEAQLADLRVKTETEQQQRVTALRIAENHNAIIPTMKVRQLARSPVTIAVEL